MQQLITHWSSLMPDQKIATRKRRRDDTEDVTEQTQTVRQQTHSITKSENNNSQHSQYHYTNGAADSF